MRKKVKAFGHWLFENFYPALFWAGLTVAVALLLNEEYFKEHACKKTRHLGNDAAKKLFLAVFLIRLFALPAVAEIIGKSFPKKSPSEETVGRLEIEFNEGIETGVFVFETLEHFKAPMWLGIMFSVPAVWPVFCAIYKFYNPDFIRGPKRRYKRFKPTIKKYGFIFMEAAYNLLSLASATEFLVSLLFNIFYNSVHPKSYAHEKAVLAGLMGLASIVGVASVKGFRSYKVMAYSEAFINTLYYTLNVSVATAACLNPSSFTDNGFKQSGWIYTLCFGVLSLVLAIIGGLHGLENPYEHHSHAAHSHHEKHGTRYLFGLFPIEDSDYDEEDSILGLNPSEPTDEATFYRDRSLLV